LIAYFFDEDDDSVLWFLFIAISWILWLALLIVTVIIGILMIITDHARSEDGK